MHNTAISAFAARHYGISTICCVRRAKKFRPKRPEFNKILKKFTICLHLRALLSRALGKTFDCADCPVKGVGGEN